jgi:UDP-N-acetylmuramoyl-L-alanyl-D-glutamate--2,6-diaminopimelate ligase
MKRGTSPLFTSLPVTLRAQLVAPGGTFVALQGAREHGMHYIPEAIARGARTLVIEKNAPIDDQIMQRVAAADVQVQYAEQGRKTLAHLSAAHHHYPARSVCMIGVTGTKGKTTTTYLIHHILQFCGYRTALLSTVDNIIMNDAYAAELTTPQADYLHAFLRTAVDRGVTHVVMEVAAQALSTQRVEGVAFDHVVWLNFAREHGEFYQSLDEYFSAKELLLQHVTPDGGIIHASSDDVRIHEAVKRVTSRHTFFSRDKMRLQKTDLAQQASWYQNGDAVVLCRNVYGAFNGENIAAALSVVESLGIDRAQAVEALQRFPGVPGRMNWYALPNGARACIDYAHTPESFRGILSELRHHTDHLVVVFGAGGDRDSTKRPLMGAIVAEYADEIIVTNDNPRSENPENIIADICAGISEQLRVAQELDREQAIQQAYAVSRAGSIIALLGKGPDEYQLVQGVKHHFSEREILGSL